MFRLDIEKSLFESKRNEKHYESSVDYQKLYDELYAENNLIKNKIKFNDNDYGFDIHKFNNNTAKIDSIAKKFNNNIALLREYSRMNKCQHDLKLIRLQNEQLKAEIDVYERTDMLDLDERYFNRYLVTKKELDEEIAKNTANEFEITKNTINEISKYNEQDKIDLKRKFDKFFDGFDQLQSDATNIIYKLDSDMENSENNIEKIKTNITEFERNLNDQHTSCVNLLKDTILSSENNQAEDKLKVNHIKSEIKLQNEKIMSKLSEVNLNGQISTNKKNIDAISHRINNIRGTEMTSMVLL